MYITLSYNVNCSNSSNMHFDNMYICPAAGQLFQKHTNLDIKCIYIDYVQKIKTTE